MKKILLALSLLASSYSFAQTKISAEKALEDLSKNSEIQLLDVRTAKEFESKHVKDAINIDWKDQTSFETKASNFDKSKPLYIYCLGGGRSAEAAKKLTAMGFDVYDIDGGIMKWEGNNLPLEKSSTDKKNTGLSIEEYKKIVQNNDVVLVDFYATWCPPCKKQGPIIDQIAKKYEGKIKVLKVDVDQSSELCKTLNITSMPTLIVYKKNKQTWTKSGLVNQKTIEKKL